MNKLWLIIKREYLTRVKKRSFILGTVLTPLAFGLFFVVVGFIFSYEGEEELRIALVDQSGIFELNKISDIEDSGKKIYFKESSESLESLLPKVKDGDYDGVLLIPPLPNLKTKRHEIKFYSDKSLNISASETLEDKIESGIRDYKIDALKLDKEQVNTLNTRVAINPEPLDDSERDASAMTSVIGAGLGGLMGFIMYLAVFIYGMMVMRSVMEEKMNRIVEVMISTVRPFQLMLGKIIGVGAVGLTQVAIWVIMIPLIYLLVMLVFGFDPQQMQAGTGMDAPGAIDPDDIQAMGAQISYELGNQNWWLILPLFILYFLGGYFLYSSLFAAVGSAMGDDLGEGQALTIPITIPVILAFYIMIVALRDPESNLAVWSSIFPLFSPIVMPARLAFDPPMWQIAASLIVLAATCVFFVWLSARIYRVGILMYGKKVSLKELGKWVFYKD